MIVFPCCSIHRILHCCANSCVESISTVSSTISSIVNDALCTHGELRTQENRHTSPSSISDDDDWEDLSPRGDKSQIDTDNSSQIEDTNKQ